MDFNLIFEALSGQAGVIALLILLGLAFMKGNIVPRMYYDLEVDRNKELTDSLENIDKSMATLIESSKEAKEDSETTLKLIEELRRQAEKSREGGSYEVA